MKKQLILAIFLFLFLGTASAQTAADDLTPSPASLDFAGNVKQTIASQMMTFTNNTAADILVSSVAINGSDAFAFSIVQENCLNEVVQINDTCNVTIVASRANTGDFAATLAIGQSGGDSVSVPLTATISAGAGGCSLIP
jgi:hypothetical protein